LYYILAYTKTKTISNLFEFLIKRCEKYVEKEK